MGDEAHHVPADIALDIFFNLQADVRIGLTATPFREDGQADLLPALFGLPVGADWPVSPSQKPAVTVWIVNDDAGKIRKTKDLCAAPVERRERVTQSRSKCRHRSSVLGRAEWHRRSS